MLFLVDEEGALGPASVKNRLIHANVDGEDEAADVVLDDTV